MNCHFYNPYHFVKHTHPYIDVHGIVAKWSSGQIFLTSIQISLIIFSFFNLVFQNV